MQIQEQLWAAYRQELYLYLLTKTNDADTAEDILQEALLKAYTTRSKLHDLTRLKPWLFAIARNTLVDRYRYYKPLESFQLDRHDLAQTESDAEDHTLVNCLTKLAEQLPWHYKQAISLADLGAMKQRELAAYLNISVSGAKSRVQRARTLLKDALFDCCLLEFNADGIPTRCTKECAGGDNSKSVG